MGVSHLMEPAWAVIRARAVVGVMTLFIGCWFLGQCHVSTCEACPSQNLALMLVKANVFSYRQRQLLATKVLPTSVSPLCSLNYTMKRQLNSTRNEVRIKVARSAEAQPEETDPAKAASVNLKLLGQNDPPSRRLTSPHFVCSCRCELCHPGEHLDVLRGSHTDSLIMDEADIEDLQDRRWDASSLMVMKSSVYTSQAKSIKPS